MDATQFKELFLPHHRRLYRTAFCLLGDAQNAEDVVQEVYLKLWDKRDELAKLKNTEAFLVTLTKNLSYDLLRSLHPEQECTLSDKLPIVAEDNVAQATEARDEVEVVRQLIAHLPEDQRRVITMRDVNGWGYDEIERATQLSPINIRVLLSRARKKIREQFNAIRNYERQ